MIESIISYRCERSLFLSPDMIESKLRDRSNLLVVNEYGVAMISRLLQITGLFCKKAYKRDEILQKRSII